MELKSGVDYTSVSDGVTRLKTMFFEGLDKVNIHVDDLLRVHPSPTMAPGNLSAASRTSAGLPPTPAGALVPTNAAVVPKLDVQGDGPLLSAGDGLPNASQSSTNVRIWVLARQPPHVTHSFQLIVILNTTGKRPPTIVRALG